MFINECKPEINDQGHLRFAMPGFGRLVGEIAPWDVGFETSLIKNERRIPSHFWPLNLMPKQPARALPDAVKSFVQLIPADIRERVSQYQFGQSLILQCIARYPAANDLSISNPRLLWLIMASVYDSKIEKEQIPILCQRKQVAILARLVRPASKAMLRLLRKVELQTGSLSEARALTDALRKPFVVAAVAHQPSPSLRLLTTLSRFPNLAKPAIVNVLAPTTDRDRREKLELAMDLSDTVADIRRMAGMLDIQRPEQALSRCRSIDDVERLHDRWVGRVNRVIDSCLRPRRSRFGLVQRGLAHCGRGGTVLPTQAENRDFVFPPPPYPDSEKIKAITSAEELYYEGYLQNNCVASYVESVANSEVYLYKVLYPHRGTLEVRKTDKGWVLGQFKLACNRRPGIVARHWVDQWYRTFRNNDQPLP